jgi:hypothetical protein
MQTEWDRMGRKFPQNKKHKTWCWIWLKIEMMLRHIIFFVEDVPCRCPRCGNKTDIEQVDFYTPGSQSFIGCWKCDRIPEGFYGPPEDDQRGRQC